MQNIPDTPPALKHFRATIEENASVGSIVGTIQIKSVGDSPIAAFMLDRNDTFVIDNNGTLYTASALDYETQANYTLQVRAKNSAGWGAWASLQIAIDNVIDGEPVLVDTNLSIEENASIGTEVGKIVVSSEGSSPIERFELSGNGSQHFTIDNNGTIKLAQALDYETQEIYNLKVKALNSAGWSIPANLIVRIANIPDTPPALKPFNATIEENASVGTPLGTVKVASAGEGNIAGFRLQGVGSEAFSVDSNGTIRVAQALDYETKSFYGLQVVAISDVGESSPIVFDVSVENVYEIPSIVDDFHGYVIVGEATAHSAVTPYSYEKNALRILDTGDGAPHLKWMITSGEGMEDFYIDANGVLRVSESANITSAAENLYTLKGVLQTEAGNSNEFTLIVDAYEKIDMDLFDVNLTVTEGVEPGTVVGRIPIDTTKRMPDRIEIENTESTPYFYVDKNGTIYAGWDTIDYGEHTYFEFSVTAYLYDEIQGKTDKAKVYIEVKNIETPILHRFRNTFPPNTMPLPGEELGYMQIGSELPVESAWIEGQGSENFLIEFDNERVTLKWAGESNISPGDKYVLEFFVRNGAGTAQKEVTIRPYTAAY